MARNFNDLRKSLDERLDAMGAEGMEIRLKVREDLDQEIAAHERTLDELRKARRLTQQQLARSLGVSQAQVSRIETQTDLYLSTLQSYLQAMGGRLEIFGVFGKDDDPVRVPLSIGEIRGTPECELGGHELFKSADLMEVLERTLTEAKTSPVPAVRQQRMAKVRRTLEQLEQLGELDPEIHSKT